MRIVAGSAKGRALQGPKPTSKHIRPTADRVRETLFNVLGQWLEGQAVLDLYAGTGALALESLSRGAGRAVLVDSDREALALCRTNTDTLGFGERVEILAQPVERALETLGRRGDRFELVFADPPYAARVVETVLEGIARNKVLPPGARWSSSTTSGRRPPSPTRASSGWISGVSGTPWSVSSAFLDR